MDLNNINEDWKEEAPILAAMEAANPFAVPENYFEDLKEQITAILTIESITENLENGAFAVPEGYFESLNEQIESRVKLEEIIEYKDEQAFSVPQDYFEELSRNISSRVALEAIIPEKEGSFTVPENYFENLQQSILAKTTESYPEKTVKIKRLSGSWIRYAAAACVTVMIATGIFLNYSEKQDTSIDSELAKITDQEIVNYLEINSTTGDSEVIAEHLVETGVKPELNSKFSDKEIEQYLETSL